MSNRINSVDPVLLGRIGDKTGDTGTLKKVSTDASARDQEVTRQTNTDDTVELTNNAKLLERLEKTLAALPDIDDARVEAVKAQIANGEYQIDSEKIVEALLRTDQELDS